MVLYSPGGGEPRTWGTILVQDLASRGYIVVIIDHPYEASEVEFPGGRVIEGSAFPSDEHQLRQFRPSGGRGEAAVRSSVAGIRVEAERRAGPGAADS